MRSAVKNSQDNPEQVVDAANLAVSCMKVRSHLLKKNKPG
jgi:hypothetical protein